MALVTRAEDFSDWAATRAENGSISLFCHLFTNPGPLVLKTWMDPIICAKPLHVG